MTPSYSTSHIPSTAHVHMHIVCSSFVCLFVCLSVCLLVCCCFGPLLQLLYLTAINYGYCYVLFIVLNPAPCCYTSINSMYIDRKDVHKLIDSTRYDTSVYLTCSKKLTGSQLSIAERDYFTRPPIHRMRAVTQLARLQRAVCQCQCQNRFI